MKWLKNIIRIIARREIENMLNDKEYINMIKTSLQNDMGTQRVNENEAYLRSMRKL